MPAEDFFKIALQLAARASKLNEVPIGAVLVRDNKIIARAFNQTEKRGRFTAHAELLCIESASRKLNSKYLLDCELYVTLEPCLMCVYASRLSRLKAIHFLLASEKFGSSGQGYFKIQVLEKESAMTLDAKVLLQDFFKKKR